MKRTLELLLLLSWAATAQPFREDTVGGTVYDWQAYGPSRRWIACDTAYGVHVTWMHSRDTTFADRNQHYNFLDLRTETWLHRTGGDYLDWGIDVFPTRAGYGTLDVDLVTHLPFISAHLIDNIPALARGTSPAAQAFELCQGPNAFVYPDLSLTPNGVAHVSTIDVSTQREVFYFRVTPWCTWSVPLYFSDTNPQYENHFLEAAKGDSNLVAVSWIDIDQLPRRFYYKVSDNSGTSWRPQAELTPPPAYQSAGETLPTFTSYGNSLLWDHEDRLHVTVAVHPVVGGRGLVTPAEIWHYCADNAPAWAKIARAGGDSASLHGSVGNGAVYADRPSLAVDEDGRLFCVWECFDSLNVEPTTGRLRAGLFAATSSDNGSTWSEAIRLTQLDSTSHRYPSLARLAPGGRLHILYEQDLMAGFFTRHQGPPTPNPIIYLTGTIASSPSPELPAPTSRTRVSASPNLFRQGTTVTLELEPGETGSLRVFDAAGRPVKTLAARVSTATPRRLLWDGTDHRGHEVPPGAYFVRLEAGHLSRSLRLLRI
jgi:hypothetical protein